MTLYTFYSLGPLLCVYHMGCGKLMGWTAAHKEYRLIFGRCCNCGESVTPGETFTSPTGDVER